MNFHRSLKSISVIIILMTLTIILQSQSVSQCDGSLTKRSMLILTAITTILAVVLVTIVVFYHRYRSRNLPPGPWGLPLLGYLPFLGKNPEKTLTELSDKYGKVMSVNLGGFRPVVVLSDWKSVKEALVTKGEIFAGRNRDLFSAIVVEDKDIILTDGSVWRQQKKLAQQMLNRSDFDPDTVISDEVHKLSDYLDTHDGRKVDVLDLFFIPTLNVIWRIVAGKQFQQHDVGIRHLEEKVDYLLTSTKLTMLSHFPYLTHKLYNNMGLAKYRDVASGVRDYINNEIDRHLEDFDVDNIRDGIDHYLATIERKNELTGERVTPPPYDCTHLTMTIVDLIVAGHDTVKSTMSWALLYMAHFPEIQQKVQQELDKVVDRDSFVPIQSKSLIPYTEATLMEIQRFASVLPLAVPHRATQDTNLSGYDIPKDTKVIVNLYGVHHDREYWGDPEAFRPERFLDDDGQVVKHEALKPFSAGPRGCLGEGLAKQELHLFFACLMRRFTFQFVPEEPRPSLEPIFSITSKPQAFSLIVHSRTC